MTELPPEESSDGQDPAHRPGPDEASASGDAEAASGEPYPGDEGSREGQGAPTTDEPTDPLALARRIADSYRGGPAAKQYRPRRLPTSPRRRSREDPVGVADVLGDMVKQQGWDARLSQQRVFSDWPGIVGPEIAQHTTVVAFADGILEVQADSTAWATQLKLLASRLVARLNDELGHGSVLRIEVVPPRAPSWKKGSRSVRGGRGPRDTYG